MIYKSVLCALCLWLARGVFGVDADEVKSVSVMEGDSVTLHTDLTHIQTDIQILWTFKLNTPLAEIIKREQMNIYFVSKDVIFRDHLQMNNQTGSLTITNIKTEHTGLYKLMIGSDKISYTSFTVIVHARLAVPVIIRNSSQCSSSSERSSVSKCVLLCSVMNVTHVSLSWYKGNSLLSSISVSDLNIRLSLPLELEYQDNNTYRCVVSNPVSNQTQHLDINELCESCSAHIQNPYLVGITVFLVMLVVATAAVSVMWFLYNRKTRHRVQTRDEEELHYAETTFSARHIEIPVRDCVAVCICILLFETLWFLSKL
ncbi:uncharacterized protein LOC130429710 isoform X2 [Triplophysa dalaica]|uniref:uncharacterized protein LOC130429710 isoform X2 n=1 Tax=Triplophysa dalaica TaxID=1582913 RepID=UPI0024DFB961|nr:uncharacterized protein LOC130429710 isoform X2 [Triplophysa dalaica]